MQKLEKTTLTKAIRKNGILMLDGKGHLAKDCATYLDFVIDDTTPINLLEGVDPEVFANFLQRMNSPAGGDQGNSKFFSDSARNALFTSLVFQHALAKHGLAEINLTTLKVIVDQVFSQDDSLGALIDAIPLEGRMDDIFQDAMKHLVNIRGNAGEGLQGIKSSVDAWLAPFFQSKRLRHWCDCTSSAVDITDVLWGRRIGVCLPEADFPVAGKVATGILKAKLYRAIQARGEGWRAAGMSQVFLIIDEAQKVADISDTAMLPIARSLGLSCIFATQNIDSYYAEFPKDKASQMMDSFGSIVCLRTSAATYEYFRERIGKDRVWVEQIEGQNLAYGLTVKLAMADPWNDPSNPYRAWMRHFSFGIFKKVFDRLSHGKLTGQGKGGIGNRLASMKLSEQPIHILQENDIQTVQTDPFTAIASVQRAGAPRRDIIKTIPLDANFNEIPVTLEDKMAKGNVDFGEPV